MSPALRFAFFGLCAPFACSQACAQAYPVRPIRMIVPFAAGGTTDVVGRIVAQKLHESLGQPVPVENRAGASGMIAAELVAKAPPDGYVLITTTQTTHAVAPSLYRKVSYDPVRDFAPISLCATSPLILIVHPSLPARTVQDLIRFAKGRPGELNFASGGNGTSPHLSAELFKTMGGISMVHLPYKGEAPALIDVIAGQVPLMFSNIPAALPHATAGKVRALGVTSAARSGAAPDLPTIAESGLPGFEVVTWFGVLAPAGTPREIVSRLNGEIVRGLNQPDIKTRLIGQGVDVIAGTPEHFAAYIKSELTKWAKVIQAAGARVD